MTIIIAMKDTVNNCIILGADNQATAGQLCYKGGKKIFSLDIPVVDDEGEVIKEEKLYVAMSGNYWLINFLVYGFDVPAMCEDWDFLYYLYNCFFVALAEVLFSNCLIQSHEGMLDSEAGMLFVFGGRIFHVFDNFSVMECVEDFDVDGSGSEIAIGSLATNLMFNGGVDRLEMVREAVVVCGLNNIYCDGDVDLEVISF